MIDATRRIRKRCLDVGEFKIGQFFHNIGMGESRRQQVENIDDSDSEPANTGPATEHMRVRRDTSKQIVHVRNLPGFKR
jgi:hypothetical protein